MTQLTESQERTWAMLCHASAFAGYILPFGNIIGPLIVWLIKRQESPLVDDQGRESLNFQISILIYVLVASVLVLVLIGYLLLAALLIFNIVSVVIASVRSYRGEPYRYAYSIRFIK